MAILVLLVPAVLLLLLFVMFPPRSTPRWLRRWTRPLRRRLRPGHYRAW